MTGILIIAHAPLASALERCVEHVYSCEPGMTRANLRVLDVQEVKPCRTHRYRIRSSNGSSA